MNNNDDMNSPGGGSLCRADDGGLPLRQEGSRVHAAPHQPLRRDVPRLSRHDCQPGERDGRACVGVGWERVMVSRRAEPRSVPGSLEEGIGGRGKSGVVILPALTWRFA